MLSLGKTSKSRKLLIPTLLLALGILAVAVQSVAAHAVPEASSPAPNESLETAPAQLVISFNEPVVPALSSITLLTQAGAEVETGAITAVTPENRVLQVELPELSEGAYLVSWRVLSAVDGHTTSGTFSFGIGVAALASGSGESTITAQFSLLNSIARWLTLTGTAVLMGVFAFRLFVWNPMLADIELEEEEELLDLRLATLSLRAGVGALALTGLGLLLIFIDQNRAFNLLAPNNLQIWFGTQFGIIWLVRALLLALTHFHLSLFMDVRLGRAELRGWEWWAGLFMAMILALTSSLISHSAALAENTWQAVLIDFSHILAATMWIGGVLFLAIALWQMRRVSAEARAWLNLSLILNFSGLAAIAVGILLTSGTYLAWTHINSWTKLVGTAYGLILLAKIGLALIAFILAGINLQFLKPRLNDAYEAPETAAAQQVLRRFRILVTFEGVVLLLILAATGLLSDIQRGVDAPLLADAPGRTVVSQDAENLHVDMVITPALVGQNEFEIYITDENGTPVADVDEVSVRFTFLEQSVGAAFGDAKRIQDGVYNLEGSFISLIGGWQVEISIQRPGEFDTFAAYRLDAGVGGNIREQNSGTRPLEQFAKFMTLAGGGGSGTFLILAAILWGFVAAKAARNEWQLIPLLAISLLIFWFGANNLITFFQEDYTPAKFTTNPILPDVESVAVGQALFKENCITCHGPEGRGNGPTAQTLSPPPADFAAGHTDTHPDGDLYYWIREGITDTAMPAFRGEFSNDEIWHLVNFIRRLSASS